MMARLARRTAFFVGLALGAPVMAACGSDCPPPPQQCPAPPKAGPIDIGGVVDLPGGGKGSATLTIPGYGETTVSLDCKEPTVKKNTPAAGTTQVTIPCTFRKWGGVITGSIDVVIEIDANGKGKITASGSASLPTGTENINVTIDLNGGGQVGQTVELQVSVNGACSTGTLKRDNNTVTITVDQPFTKITITKK